MADPLTNKIIAVIKNTLESDGTRDCEPIVINSGDSMETVPAWDSLNFMNVFMAINEAFSISPDFDDAIHYLSIESLRLFLVENSTTAPSDDREPHT